MTWISWSVPTRPCLFVSLPAKSPCNRNATCVSLPKPLPARIRRRRRSGVPLRLSSRSAWNGGRRNREQEDQPHLECPGRSGSRWRDLCRDVVSVRGAEMEPPSRGDAHAYPNGGSQKDPGSKAEAVLQAESYLRRRSCYREG